ncbi:MAG TPA: prepilin peptidase, partial [Polyangiaceae bacterium]|nr:prepilin peptidase [Polyangiaceae bacterium]
PIRPWNNVPVLSYLFLRGRASCCQVPISPRYPLVELSGGLLAWAILRCIVFELPVGASLGQALGLFGLYLALGLALLALAFIDLEYMLLPDSLTLGGALLGLLSAGFRGPGYTASLLGALLGFLLIYLPFDLLHRLLRGYPGMGLGDAKLTLLAGAWFGARGALFALFAGAVQATLVVLAVFLARGKIEEPEAVRLERQELEAAIENATGEERAELERERELDPAMRAPETGLHRARVPFGPFLALATLEYALLERAGLSSLFDVFTDAWS